MHRRAYFHAQSCAFVLWLFIEPVAAAIMFEARKVAQSRHQP